MTSQESAVWIGQKLEKEGKVCKVGIRIESLTIIKILSIISVETDAPGEKKTVLTKLRVDFFSLSIALS